jgi:hypothetical protein
MLNLKTNIIIKLQFKIKATVWDYFRVLIRKVKFNLKS